MAALPLGEAGRSLACASERDNSLRFFHQPGEFVAETLVGADEAGFDSTRAPASDIHDLPVRQTVVAVQDQRQPLAVRQAGDGGADVRPALGLRQRGVGSTIGGRLGGKFVQVVGQLHRRAGALAAAVPAEVRDDAIEPGGELGGGSVARRRLEDAEKSVLGDILRGIPSAEEAVRQREGLLLVPPHEHGERAAVAAGKPGHECRVVEPLEGRPVGVKSHEKNITETGGGRLSGGGRKDEWGEISDCGFGIAACGMTSAECGT